ncbi:YveK family protein [Lihuaxuella thermophila]|uniref:Capsular polysaccharide biosynthesis protein n=1 Tax=Lihuaxuella thermophila TaxID=1173111 RepID=A0A1H8CHT9_9BACL|nr:Wzz/FepE/Etk N-terminal domain-containing protein [Lihuaxuella thermophila]SEM93647.1 Capsular polysaccharide biosynthesis protein [Lihuaxuella thermophila]
MEREIGLADIWRIIRKHLKLILTVSLLLSLATGLVIYFVQKPEYEATTYVYVKTYSSGNSFNDVLANQKDLNTHADIIRSERIANEVISMLNLKLTPDQLLQKVSVTPVKDSLILSIKVTDGNHKQAVMIANGFAEVFEKNIHHIMKVARVTVFDKAKEEPNPVPVNPSPYKYSALVFALGLMVGIAVVLLKEFFDRSIKTEQEVELLFEAPLLGVITNFEKEKKAKV